MPKAKRERVKTQRETPGSKTYVLSGPHLLKSWQPPTSYCGVKLWEGLRYSTPGYENAPFPIIECETCRESVG